MRTLTSWCRMRMWFSSAGGALGSHGWYAALFMVAVDSAQAKGDPASPGKIWEQFSGEKALAHVQQLVDFGPHPPGSEAIEKSREYIEKQLKLYGWQVAEQAFTDETPRGTVRFVNVVARFPGAGNADVGGRWFLLC